MLFNDNVTNVIKNKSYITNHHMVIQLLKNPIKLVIRWHPALP